jgi:outer membrane lipase/esterase
MRHAGILVSAAAWALSSLSVGQQSDAAPTKSADTQIRRIVTFGDSWSDAGTFGQVFGTLPGPAWPGLLSQRYQHVDEPFVTLDGPRSETFDATKSPPPLRTVGGLNFAQGGARVAAAKGTSHDALPWSLPVQLEHFLAANHRFDADELVIVWAGGNDLVAPFSTRDNHPSGYAFSTGQLTAAMRQTALTDADETVAAQIAFVKSLLNHGARHVAVLDLIDLSITPFQNGLTPKGLAFAGELSSRFNAKLTSGLPVNPRILPVHLSQLFSNLLADPAKYGYSEVIPDACNNASYMCASDHFMVPSADQTFMFAGWGHFTAHTRQVIADEVYREVTARWPAGAVH